MILEALKGLAAIPEIVEQLKGIGSKLDAKQALERLDAKRDRNRDAIDRVLGSKAGQRGEIDSSPVIREGDDGST